MTMTLPRRLGASLALLGVASLAAACGGRGGDGETAGEGGQLATAPGFDGKQFTVGAISVTSGPAAPANAPSLGGMDTYIKALNARGGIGGKYPVRLLVRDSQYDPARAVQAYTATKNDVAVYSQIFGTPHTLAVLPQLEADNAIALAGGTFDGTLVRQPNIMPVGTPYESQIINGIGYLRDQPGGRDKRVCGAGQEGALAETTEAALTYLKEQDDSLNLGVIVSLPTAGTDYTPQVQRLRRDGCEIIFVVASPVPVASNALTAGARLNYDAQWIGINTAFVAAMKDSPVFDYMLEHYIQYADNPTYGTENVPGMKAFMDAHERYNAKAVPEWAFLSGYILMMQVDQLLTEAVRRGDVSRDGLVAAMNDLEELDMQGLQYPWASYGAPDERRLPATFGINAPDADSEIGVTVREAGIESEKLAVDYPYPEPK